MCSFVKRAMSITLSIVMIVCVIAVGGGKSAKESNLFSLVAEAATNPYPTSQTFQYNGRWYTTIPCTRYAWQQVYDRLGIALPAWGDAGTWLGSARAAGYATGSTPQANSLAVWINSGWGHVAFVTAVNGNSWTYNEGGTADARADSNGIYVGHPYPDGYTSYPNGFIYLTPTHTCSFTASAAIAKAPTRTESGTRVRYCSCGKSQTQTIPKIPYTTDLAEGVYTITTKCKDGLKIATNSSSNYNVFIAENSYADQYWLFRKNSDGTYSIESAYYNNKVLDVEGESMVNDGNIFAYDFHGNSNQRFYIIPSGNYYKLVAKNSYLNVDNSGARTNSGNNIMQCEDNGTDAQMWAIKSANPPINLSNSSVTVSPGGSVTVNCTVGREMYGVYFSYTISNSSVCSASWGGWNGMTKPLTIKGNYAGSTTITVRLRDADTDILLATKTINVTVPDTVKPTASFSSTNNVSSSQTVTLTMSDNIGLAGYYWGTSSSYSNNTYTAVSGTSKTATKTVSVNGTYYLTVKDTAGNVSTTDYDTFYKTTLDAQSGSVSPSSVITISGNSFYLPTPTRSGYSFQKWNTKSDGTGTSYLPGASYKPTGNITLYAQWQANNYSVVYYSNGGTSAPAAQTKTHGTGLRLTANTPTRSGYTFKSWNTLSDGSGTKYMPGDIYTLNADLVLYAQWEANTYTITFNPKGGTVSTTSKQVKYGNYIGDLPTPQREGYVFVGWCANENTYYNEEEFSISSVTSIGHLFNTNDLYKFDSDKTLFAVWDSKPTGDISSTSNLGHIQTVSLNISDDISAQGFYWGTSDNYEENEYTETKSLTFDNNGISSIPQSSNPGMLGNGTPFDIEEVNHNIVQIRGATPIINLKTYKSRTVNVTVSEPGTYYLTVKDYSGTLSETVSITFYELTLETPIDSVPDEVYLLPENSIVTLPELKSDDGAWKMDSWENGKYRPGDSLRITGDMKLWTWTFYDNPSLTYFVEYDGLGAQMQPSNSLVYRGTNYTVSDFEPIRKYYRFTGWNTEPDGSGDNYMPNDIYYENEDVMLYAQWEYDHVCTYHVEKTEPTCTEAGNIRFYCECGDTFESAIPPLEHIFGSYEYNNDATSEKDGTETAYCERCSAADTRVKPGTKLKPDDSTDSDNPGNNNPVESGQPQFSDSFSNLRIYVGRGTTVECRSTLGLGFFVENIPVGYNVRFDIYQNDACISTNIYNDNDISNGITTKNGEYWNEDHSSRWCGGTRYVYDVAPSVITYKVSLCDKNGEIVTDDQGKEISRESGKITVNDVGFFKRIILFFKSLFGRLPTVYIDSGF